jgi:hypothetical protein
MLLAGPMPEVVRFIQVVSWIIIPLLLGSILLTLAIHSRNRRKKIPGRPTEDEPLLRGSPEQMGYTRGDGEFVWFDTSGVIREYKTRLLANQARNNALEMELDEIKKRHLALAIYTQTRIMNANNPTMPHSTGEQIPVQFHSDVNQIVKEEDAEKKELYSKIVQLERSCRQLEDENTALKEQLSLDSATDDHRAGVMHKWREENERLRSRVADQEYLQDLVDEKKAQVLFLQNQVEQRIKNLYQSEHQRLQVVAERKRLKEEKELLARDIESVKEDLKRMQDESGQLRGSLAAREEEIFASRQLAAERQERINFLEKELQESTEQYETLSRGSSEAANRLGEVHTQLENEKHRREELLRHLGEHKQQLMALYENLSLPKEESGKNESPVIALNPGYSSSGPITV